MPRIRVLIVDDIEETRHNIKRLLQFEAAIKVVGEAASGEEAIRQAETLRPDIVLMDINMPGVDGLKATEAISTRFPNISIIIISVQGEPEYLKRAMAAGAREFLTKPFTAEELVQTIRHTYQAEKKRLGNYQQALKTTSAINPQIITIFSPKGGIGKTTLSVNLAVALQQLYQVRVALVDLDLQFGDTAVFLNLMPRASIADLASKGEEIDTWTIENYLTAYEELKVLPAPLRPEYAELITAPQVEKWLKGLKQNFDFIIVDTPSSFNETTLTALDQASQVLLLCNLELSTLKNLKLALEVLEALHHTEKIKLILNCTSPEQGIKPADLEECLNFKIAGEIPYDPKTVVSSINKGTPFITSYANSRIALAVRNLAAALKKWAQNSTSAETSRGRRSLIGILPILK